jgi:hypothetical protein
MRNPVVPGETTGGNMGGIELGAVAQGYLARGVFLTEYRGTVSREVYPGQTVRVALGDLMVPAILITTLDDRPWIADPLTGHNTSQGPMTIHTRITELSLGFHSRHARLMQVLPVNRVRLFTGESHGQHSMQRLSHYMARLHPHLNLDERLTRERETSWLLPPEVIELPEVPYALAAGQTAWTER